MNEDLNLGKILQYCPKGTKLYSPALGEVDFAGINYYDRTYPIMVKTKDGTFCFTKQGKLYNIEQSECLLFPSREERDWSKFKPKKDRFDPKTLVAFEKVLVRLTKDGVWNATFFSHYDKEVNWGCYPFVTTSCKSYDRCIPYNEETKHLVGTTDEAPEYYRYWEA